MLSNKRRFLIGVSALFLASSTSYAGSPMNFSFSTTSNFFSPCARDGLGEMIDASGNLRVIMSANDADNSGAEFTIQKWSFSGVGTITGQKYMINTHAQILSIENTFDTTTMTTRSNLVSTSKDGSVTQITNKIKIQLIDGAPSVSIFNLDTECKR